MSLSMAGKLGTLDNKVYQLLPSNKKLALGPPYRFLYIGISTHFTVTKTLKGTTNAFVLNRPR